MIDHHAVHLAVRAHAESLVVATTGSQSITTLTGNRYRVSTTQMINWGFRVGMEVKPSGLADNAASTITAVRIDGLTVSRALTVPWFVETGVLSVGLPAIRGYENIPITPVADEPYCEEEYLPGGMTTATLGNFGTLEATPTYVVRLYGPQRTGMDALRRTADALLTHFAPTTPISVAGHTVRVRSDVAPTPSPLGQTEDGWAVITVSIPLRVQTPNSR